MFTGSSAWSSALALLLSLSNCCFRRLGLLTTPSETHFAMAEPGSNSPTGGDRSWICRMMFRVSDDILFRLSVLMAFILENALSFSALAAGMVSSRCKKSMKTGHISLYVAAMELQESESISFLNLWIAQYNKVVLAWHWIYSPHVNQFLEHLPLCKQLLTLKIELRFKSVEK